MKTIPLAAALCLLVSSCIPEGDLKLPLNMVPRDLGDGWPIGTPEEVGLVSASVRNAYEEVFDDDRFVVAISFLVVRDGVLVAEGYVRDLDDISRREHVQSVTKSLTSIAFGITREEGFFPDLNAPLENYLSVTDPKKAGITLEHLLTMRSGIDLANDAFAKELLIPKRKNMTEWLLDQPLKSAPGEEFEYRDCDPQLLASAILAQTGESVESILRRRVLGPLGVTDVGWEHNADGEPLAAHGVWLRPRDLAKIGEVTRARGVWQGSRLFASDWVDLATVTHTDAGSSGKDGETYGYYFWVDEPHGAYTTLGHGGNYMYVVPAERLLLVLSALPYSSGETWATMGEMAELAGLVLAGSH